MVGLVVMVTRVVFLGRPPCCTPAIDKIAHKLLGLALDQAGMSR